MFPIKDDNPTETIPYITFLLIAFNVLVFFYQLGLSQTDNYRLILEYGFIPKYFFSLLLQGT